MKIFKILGIILILAITSLIVSAWWTYFDLKEKGSEIVKCYDRNSNEIIGEECIEDNDLLSDTIIVTLFALVILIFSISVVLMDDTYI